MELKVRPAHYIICWTSSYIPTLPYEMHKRSCIQCTFNFSKDGRPRRKIMGPAYHEKFLSF